MLLPLFLIDALAAICLLYPFFSPLLSPIFTSFPLDFLFAGSVVLLAIREVLYESGAHTPGILILDSALTQLSETQYGEKANVIRDSFIQYLLDHQESGQVIFIDQKEKMPTWLGEKSKCKYYEFTKARGKGRYGLLYDVYDEE